MNAILYLFVNTERTAFKIGISRNPYQRMRSLPVDIDAEQSFEVTLSDGEASGLEDTLHYLFRKSHFQMPHGDGYTEWFHIAALPEVLAFLSEHGARLGTEEIRPLTVPIMPAHARHFARESREERAERRARQQAEKIERATTHNARVLEWCKTTLGDAIRAGAVAGIIRPRPQEPIDGHLYLQGPSKKEWADTLFAPADGLNRLEAVGFGFASIFGGYHYLDHPLVEMSISRTFFEANAIEGFMDEASFPGCTAIREYFCDLALNIGSPKDEQLRRERQVIALYISRRPQGDGQQTVYIQ